MTSFDEPAWLNATYTGTPGQIVLQMLIDADLWREYSIGEVPWLWPDVTLRMKYRSPRDGLDALHQVADADGWLLDDTGAIHFVSYPTVQPVDTSGVTPFERLFARLKYRRGQPTVRVIGIQVSRDPLPLGKALQQGLAAAAPFYEEEIAALVNRLSPPHYHYQVLAAGEVIECEDYELLPVEKERIR